MTIEIGFLGEEMHLSIKQGATFGPVTATMTNPDGTPVNLTGCGFVGTIRKKAKDTDPPIGSLTFAITDAVNGKYQFSMSDTATAALPCGESLQSGDSTFVYDIMMSDAGGNVLPLYYGKVTVFREVSHP